MNLPLLILLLVLFVVIIVSYSIKGVDFVAISLFCMFMGATITGIQLGIGIEGFILDVEWQAIIIILSMSIITKIAQDSNVLEYVAVKMFKISRGNRRTFLYLLCTITTLLAAVITDVVVVLILAPVVVRLCHFLKIRAGTYLLGMTVCISIGSIITPFSSGENIIISTAFELNTLYFIQYYWVFSFILLFFTIFLIDRFILSKEPDIEEQQKKFVLELVDADIMIKNKKMFYFNSFAIIATIILFVVLPLLYLTAMIAALILVLVNRSYTKKPMGKILRDIEWEIIFFFISLYIIVGSLLRAGFQEIFANIPFELLNPILLAFILLILISLISGFVANTPTALIFIPIIQTLIDSFDFPSVPILFAFIVAINLGGNLIPQGAASDLMTLKVAQDSGVENLGYKRLLKTGAIFATIHIICSTGFLFILILLP
ncbi:MAG: SLC13 family permease [Promethearchaeota archaeon]|jgi:Na+/H+ antiporter NhaD/arsenite permease-like protein